MECRYCSLGCRNYLKHHRFFRRTLEVCCLISFLWKKCLQPTARDDECAQRRRNVVLRKMPADVHDGTRSGRCSFAIVIGKLLLLNTMPLVALSGPSAPAGHCRPDTTTTIAATLEATAGRDDERIGICHPASECANMPNPMRMQPAGPC